MTTDEQSLSETTPKPPLSCLNEPGRVFRVPEHLSAQLAPAEWCVFEWTTYRATFPNATTLHVGSTVIAADVISDDGGVMVGHFSVRFENQLGVTRIVAYRGTIPVREPVHVEVLAKKFNDPEHSLKFLESMLNDLFARGSTLPFVLNAATQRGVHDAFRAPNDLFAFHFFRHRGKEIIRGLQAVLGHTHRVLGDEAEMVRIHEVKHIERESLVRMLQASPRPGAWCSPCTEMTTRRIQEQYEEWLSAGMSSRMIHLCHIVLSQAMALAVRHDLIYRNPCTGVELPRIERSDTKVWTSDEVASFLKEAKDDAWAPLWFLLAMEGMRRGEALGLRWSDVNWHRSMAHVFQTIVLNKKNRGGPLIQPRTKTHAGARTVSPTKETIAILETHQDRQRYHRQTAGSAWEDNDLILCTSTGRPLNPSNVTRSYNHLAMISVVPRIKLHGLRHSHASLLLGAGIPLRIVSERLGHASIAITADLYAHVSESMQETAADAMSDLIQRTGYA